MKMLSYILGHFGLLLFASGSVLGDGSPKTPPNVLVILSDDMGYSDLGYIGGDIQTPNLDGLIKDGILFPNFYNNAKCAPTRASLLTGMSNHKTGADHGSGETVKFGGLGFAEAMKGNYKTLMIRKWHHKPAPLELGFERYFGSSISPIYFWPAEIRKDDIKKIKLDGEPYSWEQSGVASVEDWFMPIEATKYAIQYVEEEVVQAKEKKPFFMHYALHAPHWPLQALREDVEIYLDALKDGTDAVRQRRYDHMIQQGIFDRETCLLEPANEAWDDLSPERQAYYRRALAVHYAMVHRMDIELGKFFDYLKEKGLWENTLIFFCSDNGASGEGDTTVIPEGGLLGDRGTQARIDSIGAQMCNTPFRGNKSTLHEGGNCTPMIVHWPAAIGKPGRISRQVGHVMDIMPTVLEAAGIEYPESFEGRKLQKMDGVSLLPAILEEREFHRSFVQHYEKFDNVHDGYWKLIRQNSKKTTAPKSPWELYHLEKDRTQQNNVADLYPERVASMAAMYDDWSGEVKTILEGVYEKHPKFSKEYKMAEKIRKGKVKPHKMKKNKKKSKS